MESARSLQTRMIVREAPKTLMLGIASAWLLAFAMCAGQFADGYAWRATAWAALLSLLLLRGIVIARAGYALPEADSVHAVETRLQRNAMGVSVMWGLSAVFLLPAADFEHDVLLVVAISMITMGGAIGRTTHVPNVARFVILTSTVFACGLIVRADHFHRYIGLGYLLFGPAIALFTRAQENQVQRERELNVEVERLLMEARIARDDAERARADADEARVLAERVSAARARFLATASHDLRQPMHSIGLVVGILHDRVRDPELAALTSKVQNSVAAMEGLFGSLLDISKLDAGVVRPEFTPVEVGRLLARGAETWAPLAAERGLSLRVRAVPRIVRSDAQLLERILGNLVSNAIRYTTRGGVLVACRARGSGCALQVWDTGPGIDPANHAMIFEEFYRIGMPGRGYDEGLGLGLSIVQRSATLLGHPLRLASRPGRGSMFELWLQDSPDPLPALVLQPGADAQDGLAGAFVVVVDDNRHNREAMAQVFRNWGCHVVEGESGASLTAALAEHLRTPDLAVVDYRIGTGETGFEIVAALRRDGDSTIPALLVTADTSSALARRAAAMGLGILHKPVGLLSLRRAAIAAMQADCAGSPPGNTA